MRNLVLIILLAAAGWSTFWYVGKTNRASALTEWLEDRNDAGWVANSTVNLRGFPNRYDAILEGINLADPVSGWAWSAPRFELLQLSYQPNHYIALWPQRQQIKTPDQKLIIDSTDLRASVIFEGDQELSRATLTAQDFKVKSTAGWDALTKGTVLAVRKSDEGENKYDLGLDFQEFTPPNQLVKELDRAGIMPASFNTFKMDATAQFDAPLSQTSFENGQTRLNAMDLKDLNVSWGDFVLRGTGEVQVGADQFLIGNITIRATNWEQMLDMGVQSGAIPSDYAGTVRTALTMMSALSGNRNELDIPLRFQNGQTKLGPLTIGEAPRLSLPN